MDDSDSPTFRSPEEIRSVMAESGITPDDDIVISFTASRDRERRIRSPHKSRPATQSSATTWAVGTNGRRMNPCLSKSGRVSSVQSNGIDLWRIKKPARDKSRAGLKITDLPADS